MSSRMSKRFQFEGLELRTMMAVDLPRAIPAAAGGAVLQVAPLRARATAAIQGGNAQGPAGNGPGGNLPGEIIADRALLRAVASAAIELRLIDEAMHRLLTRVTDKTDEAIAAQLTRIQSAADHIVETVVAALPDDTEVEVVVVTSAAPNQPGGANLPFEVPPVGELLTRALTLLADRIERVDRRLTDALAGIDSSTLSTRVIDQLQRIEYTATHISDDIDALPVEQDPPPTPEERRLSAVVEQLEVAETVLTRTLNELGPAGSSLPPLVERFLDNIDEKADSLETQIETALGTEGEPGEAAAKNNAAADHGNGRPRPILALPGLAIVNAAVARAEQEVRRIIDRLPVELTDRVEAILAEIAEHAAGIREQVAPYIAEEAPTEPE